MKIINFAEIANEESEDICYVCGSNCQGFC